MRQVSDGDRGSGWQVSEQALRDTERAHFSKPYQFHNEWRGANDEIVAGLFLPGVPDNGLPGSLRRRGGGAGALPTAAVWFFPIFLGKFSSTHGLSEAGHGAPGACGRSSGAEGQRIALPSSRGSPEHHQP